MLSQKVIRDLENKLCLNYPGRFIIRHTSLTCTVRVSPYPMPYSNVVFKIVNILDIGLVPYKKHVFMYIVCKTNNGIMLLYCSTCIYEIQNFLHNNFDKDEQQSYMCALIEI